MDAALEQRATRRATVSERLTAQRNEFESDKKQKRDSRSLLLSARGFGETETNPMTNPMLCKVDS